MGSFLVLPLNAWSLDLQTVFDNTMRYQLVSHSQDLETLLVESEEVDLLMQQAVDDGLVQS